MRLLWGSIGTFVVLGIAALIVFVPNTGHSFATPIDENLRAQVYRTPKTVEASAEQKAAAVSTLSRFVRSAVIRRDLNFQRRSGLLY